MAEPLELSCPFAPDSNLLGLVFLVFVKDTLAQERLAFAAETKFKPSHPVTPCLPVDGSQMLSQSVWLSEGSQCLQTLNLPAEQVPPSPHPRPAVNAPSLDPGPSKIGMDIGPVTDAAHVIIWAFTETVRRHRAWVFLLCRYEGGMYGG